MVAPILKALGAGYTPKTILKYILSKFPQHAGVVNSALAAGYTADSILRHLTKQEVQDSHGGSKTEQQQAREMRSNRKKKIMTNTVAALGTAGAVGAGLYNLYKSSSAIGGAAAATSPQQTPPPGPQGPLPTPPPATPTQAVQQTPGQVPTPAQNPSPVTPVQGAKAAQTPSPVTPIAAQAAATPPPQAQPQEQAPIAPVASPTMQASVTLIDNIGEGPRLRNLIEGGMPEADIGGLLRKVAPKDKVKALESVPGGLEQAVRDYSEYVKQTQPAPKEVAPLPKSAAPVIENPQAKAMPSVARAKLVITKNGDLGTLENLKGKVAEVKIGNKMHKKNAADIIESPLREDELADAYDNLMAKTPEKERSAAIFWAGYDENKNTLGYIPHGGKYYEFENIPPDYAEAIKNEAGAARTEGETREGLWTVGGASRGTLIYNLIEKLRKGKESAKKNQPEFDLGELAQEKKASGMAPIFDALAAGRNASRARDKKIAAEERQKRKAEKASEKKPKRKKQT